MGEILRRFRENQTWMEPFEAESAWVASAGAELLLGRLLQRLRRGIYKDAADIHQRAVLRVV